MTNDAIVQEVKIKGKYFTLNKQGNSYSVDISSGFGLMPTQTYFFNTKKGALSFLRKYKTDRKRIKFARDAAHSG